MADDKILAAAINITHYVYIDLLYHDFTIFC